MTVTTLNAAADIRDTHFSRLLNPLPGFILANRDRQPVYAESCTYVADRFRRQYGAEVTHFMPWLLNLQCLGGISAVVGMKPAVIQNQANPLFLEHYLDQPVEKSLQAATGQQVAREHIVEIGNLVASQRGASQLIFLLMTASLRVAGFQWMVFTATRTLRNTLERLDFPLTDLGEANPDVLSPEERTQWGSYYSTEPRVLAARLDDLDLLLEKRPLLRQALRVYQDAMLEIANDLRSDS